MSIRSVKWQKTWPNLIKILLLEFRLQSLVPAESNAGMQCWSLLALEFDLCLENNNEWSLWGKYVNFIQPLCNKFWPVATFEKRKSCQRGTNVVSYISLTQDIPSVCCPPCAFSAQVWREVCHPASEASVVTLQGNQKYKLKIQVSLNLWLGWVLRKTYCVLKNSFIKTYLVGCAWVREQMPVVDLLLLISWKVQNPPVFKTLPFISTWFLLYGTTITTLSLNLLVLRESVKGWDKWEKKL